MYSANRLYTVFFYISFRKSAAFREISRGKEQGKLLFRKPIYNGIGVAVVNSIFRRKAG